MVDLEVVVVDESDVSLVRQAYALICEEFGMGNVEDESSFGQTVASLTDYAVVPVMVCAVDQIEVRGVVLGVYLENINVGMTLYSAVTKSFQRTGIYSILRGQLILRLNALASERNPGLPQSRDFCDEIRYLVSEQEECSLLLKRYILEWGSYVVPFRYEQPSTQGLMKKKMKLVFQPVAKQVPPSRHEVENIVHEIYTQVYRLSGEALSSRLDPLLKSFAPNF